MIYFVIVIILNWKEKKITCMQNYGRNKFNQNSSVTNITTHLLELILLLVLYRFVRSSLYPRHLLPGL